MLLRIRVRTRGLASGLELDVMDSSPRIFESESFLTNFFLKKLFFCGPFCKKKAKVMHQKCFFGTLRGHKRRILKPTYSIQSKSHFLALLFFILRTQWTELASGLEGFECGLGHEF